VANVSDTPPEEVFRGHGERYPWNEWTDGRVWTIAEGEDFEIGYKNMQVAIHVHARSNGFKVRTRTDKEKKTITFSFAPQQEACDEEA